MTSEEIVEGLKSGLAKGESLREAMMSFYNAGYKKEDIEQAARILQTQGPENFIMPQKQVIRNPLNNPLQQHMNHPKNKTGPSQRISGYEDEAHKVRSKKGLVFIFILFFILLAGILISAYLFKDKISDWISSLT